MPVQTKKPHMSYFSGGELGVQRGERTHTSVRSVLRTELGQHIKNSTLTTLGSDSVL